jgi:hypothetical protein
MNELNGADKSNLIKLLVSIKDRSVKGFINREILDYMESNDLSLDEWSNEHNKLLELLRSEIVSDENKK